LITNKSLFAASIWSHLYLIISFVVAANSVTIRGIEDSPKNNSYLPFKQGCTEPIQTDIKFSLLNFV
jgi:hypothetical protein